MTSINSTHEIPDSINSTHEIPDSINSRHDFIFSSFAGEKSPFSQDIVQFFGGDGFA